MGCLRLNIESAINCACCKGKECISIVVDALNKVIAAITNPCNTKPSVSTHGANSSINVSVGIVCSVGLGRYEVFYVGEGPFTVEDGVFKVLKER